MKFSMHAVLAAIGLLVSCPVTAADLTLLSQGNGTWREISELSQIPANRTHTVLRVSVADDPQPPIPPGDDSIRDKVTVFSKDCLKDQAEARALSLVVRLFARPDADLSNAKAALKSATTVLEGSFLKPEGRYLKWLAKLDEISPAVYTKTFIKAVDEGLSEAWDLPSGALESNEIARLDLINLIKLIQLIFELLKNLGIFGGNSTAYIPDVFGEGGNVFDDSGKLLHVMSDRVSNVRMWRTNDIQGWFK